MKFKKWIPGIMLGTMMAVMVTVPVMADNINSGSTLPPPIEFTKTSSTNDVAADSKNNDDSGNVYDFKDSKTSGVVTVTKTWEDNLSNDERSIPDVSISTEKPSKNPLGYTITYHGNGLTFADGTTENEIIVNSSGKIVSGQYKELSGFLGWYSDKACTQKIKVDSAGLPVNGINTDLDLYAKQKTFVLKTGSGFNKLIPSTATSVVFTDEIMPVAATLIDVDADGDGGVVAWMDGTTMKLSTQIPGQKVVASSCYLMFYSKYLISIDFSNLNTNNVTDMSKMFYYCRGLTNLNLTSLDTSNVTDMSYMFSSCSDLTNLDLTHLDTQNVTSMGSMFSNCSGLTSLDLSHLNTSNVTDMSYMFNGCSGLTSLDLTPLDTSNVTNMDSMFSGCRGLTNLNLTPLDTSNVISMGGMFYNCRKLTNLDLTSLNTQNVANMSEMFYDCSGLTSLDLTSLNTQNVTNMSEMFEGCSGLTSLDLTPLDTSNVTDMSYMFRSCSDLTNLDLTHLDTQNVTSMSSMFSNCSGLTSLDLSHLDTSNVTNMNCMFYSCSGLISLDLTRLDTQDVTNMRCMFYGCSKLTSLDLTHLDTSKVTTMEEMFDRCTALTTLSLGEKFAFVGSDYCLPSGTWYSSNGTTYDSGLTSCTIPNNKADTYTRR